MLDIVIRNGSIIDGTGAARRKADVGIRGDRIEQVGNLGDAEAGQTIDASGKIVAPGFVDVHNHSDGWLIKVPHLFPKTSQGFTTEVIMADGISYAPVDPFTAPEWIFYLRSLNAVSFAEYDGWQSLADYMTRLDRANVQNTITHLPYANVRTLACGFGRMIPDDVQMLQIRSAVEQGMEEGAVGISTGLDYIAQCFASTEELVEACSAMASHRGLYVSHVRYKKGILPALREAVEIGRRAGVPVHISHLKGSTEEESEAVLEYVDNRARQEVDFSFDVYPYLPGSTMLNYLLPYEVWEEGPIRAMAKLKDTRLRRLFGEDLKRFDLDLATIAWLPGKENSRHLGKSLTEYVKDVGKPPSDALCDLLCEEGLAVLLVFNRGDDKLVHPFLAHDCYMMGTDGLYFPDGMVHPRMYGSSGRLLGPCVRDHKLFSLEEAVRKLSGYPAERFGLAGRGHIEERYYADLVVFDPTSVADRATYTDPHQCCAGVDHVLVNGVPVIAESKEVVGLEAPLPGRFLKFNRTN